MWKPKGRAFAYTKFHDHAQNSHGLLSESIFDWFTREMEMFEEQYLSNQSELGHAILRVWKPYVRAFSYTKFCVTIPSIRWVAGNTSPDWENMVKYRIPALQGALPPEILHVTWNLSDIMAVDMLGAVIPKDISICSVVEEIARQIDHFTREWARLFVCFQCDTQESITQQAGRVLPRYLTCLKALFTGFHMLYHLCR